MFIDYVKIKLASGKGGDGGSSFRREKFVPKGGPDGGDGGRGGHIFIRADRSLTTLVDFHFSHLFKSEDGEKGSGALCHGKMGKDLIIKVPPGTIIKDFKTKEIIKDLVKDGDELRMAKGGRGGRGNNHFRTSTRQAPRFHEKGEPGEESELILELKVIADVGIIGLANAGKSTLISGISNAHPKIADYPFTTLSPALGIVVYDDATSFVVADIPGLIEGASRGVGLGFEFLRHIERTKIYIHMIDGSAGAQESYKAYKTVNRELEMYNKKLLEKKQVIAVNKIDLLSKKEIKEIQAVFKSKKIKIYLVSAKGKVGLDKVVDAVYKILIKLPKVVTPEKASFRERNENITTVETVDGGIHRLKNRKMEKYVSMLDFSNNETLEVFRKFLEKNGINDYLKQHGVKEGDIIIIGEKDFVFQEEEDV
ncbi:MAG: GTPase ObgE [bacterium]